MALWFTPRALAFAPVEQELSKSYLDMASEFNALRFKLTTYKRYMLCTMIPQCPSGLPEQLLPAHLCKCKCKCK